MLKFSQPVLGGSLVVLRELFDEHIGWIVRPQYRGFKFLPKPGVDGLSAAELREIANFIDAQQPAGANIPAGEGKR